MLKVEMASACAMGLAGIACDLCSCCCRESGGASFSTVRPAAVPHLGTVADEATIVWDGIVNFRKNDMDVRPLYVQASARAEQRSVR